MQEFAAVLYPSGQGYDPKSSQVGPNFTGDPTLSIIEKIIDPDKLLIYEYTNNPLRNFIISSYSLARYIDKYKSLPQNIPLAVEEFYEKE